MAWNDVAGGAGTGATIGGAIGSIIPGVGTAIGTAAGGVLGGVAGGLFAKQPKETKIQTKQRELVDQLINSLNGDGPYASLFSSSEADFNKGFRDPAMANFRNRTAPMIQGQYTGGAYGQQRGGTGLEDQLARAGVDLDQMLNQQYAQFQQNAQNRQQDAIGRILGQSAGVQTPNSMGSQALEGLSGYLSTPGFKEDIGNILSSFNRPQQPSQNNLMDTFVPQREGFEREQQVYNPYTGVQQ